MLARSIFGFRAHPLVMATACAALLPPAANASEAGFSPMTVATSELGFATIAQALARARIARPRQSWILFGAGQFARAGSDGIGANESCRTCAEAMQRCNSCPTQGTTHS